MSSEGPRPRQLQRLYDFMVGKPYAHVFSIYRELRGRAWDGDERMCQQRVSWTITRFNRLGGPKIVPGPEVYTYTLAED